MEIRSNKQFCLKLDSLVGIEEPVPYELCDYVIRYRTNIKKTLDLYTNHILYNDLIFFVENKPKNFMKEAVYQSRLHLLKFLHNKNYKHNGALLLTWYAIKYSSQPEKQDVGGGLEILKFLHENGYEWNSFTSGRAGRQQHIDCLKYAYNNGCPFDEITFSETMIEGNIDCLYFLLQHNCPYDKGAFYCTAGEGHLDYLTILYKHNQEKIKKGDVDEILWDFRTPYDAAIYKHDDCVKFAINNGCEWDELTVGATVRTGNIPLLQFLCNKFGTEYVLSKELIELAISNKQYKMLEFLKSNNAQNLEMNEEIYHDDSDEDE